MTRDEIRELAIERVASSIRSEHWCTELDDGFGGYECCCGESWGYPTFDGCQTRHRAARTAAKYVDALGDLLPTREVEQVDWAMSGSDQMTFTVVLQTEPRKVRKALW
jgi:hypothetical protein